MLVYQLNLLWRYSNKEIGPDLGDLSAKHRNGIKTDNGSMYCMPAVAEYFSLKIMTGEGQNAEEQIIKEQEFPWGNGNRQQVSWLATVVFITLLAMMKVAYFSWIQTIVTNYHLLEQELLEMFNLQRLQIMDMFTIFHIEETSNLVQQITAYPVQVEIFKKSIVGQETYWQKMAIFML